MNGVLSNVPSLHDIVSSRLFGDAVDQVDELGGMIGRIGWFRLGHADGVDEG